MSYSSCNQEPLSYDYFPFAGGPGRPVLSNLGKYFFLKVGDSYNVRSRQITTYAVRDDESMDF